jgi:hypothetical protein
VLTGTQTLPGCESRFLNPPSAAAATLTGTQTLPVCESRFLDLPSAAAIALTGTQTLPGSESRFLNPPFAAAIMLTSAQTPPGCELCFLVHLLFADCQGNSQKAMITTCTSILKRHLIFERFHSVQLGAGMNAN